MGKVPWQIIPITKFLFSGGEMVLKLKRRFQTKNATFGELYHKNKKLCSILEDVKRKWKIWGKTRIPAGKYEIKLRPEGRVWEKYMKQKRFESIRKFVKHGLPHLQNVPNYKYILVHCGNTPKDTKGCLLPGVADPNNERVNQSTDTFLRIFPFIAKPLIRGEKVFIEVQDEAR